MDDEAEITVLDDDEEVSNQQSAVHDHNYSATPALYHDDYDAASISLAVEPREDVPPDDQKPEDKLAELTKTPQVQKGGELEKFKRRLIRAIARLIRNDQPPTEEMWEELKKQTSCDCKMLWNRMRVVAMKKLKRMFTADDVIRHVTQIAQLTATDWLMFDLVLVHEDLDVIGQDVLEPGVKESPVILEDLFSIVVIYNLEAMAGDELTKTWFEATKCYNGTERKCSPMLLQRRWYQMKKAAREKIYQFWFSYRGDQRHLERANEFKPTDLEIEIVKQFKYITTKQFPTWEKLIEQKRVSLPEDFERLQLAKRRIFRTEIGPDVEVIEPHVEIIDLDQDTNSEESRDSTHESRDIDNLKVVKTEKIDTISDDEDDVHVIESVHIPLNTTENEQTKTALIDTERNVVEKEQNTGTHNEIESFDIEEEFTSTSSKQLSRIITVKTGHNNVLEEVQGFPSDEQRKTCVETQDDVIEAVIPTTVQYCTSITNIVNDLDVTMPKISKVSSAATIDEPINNEINNILESVAENMATINKFNIPFCTDATSNKIENPITLVKNIIDEEINSANKGIALEDANMLDSVNALPKYDLNIFDGIELEDDGIEYTEDEDHVQEHKLKSGGKTPDDIECGNTPTIDLKLLLTPVVYTKKLNDMFVFRFVDYNEVKDKLVIENAENESKPTNKNSVKIEDISHERQPSSDSDVFSDSRSESHSEEDFCPETVSISSWLLNKPRKLSYNPIQLCKNPDFNTRLKRLSAGFYSSERNRHLLKDCKPLTIDLHKSFETKIYNNTLYLNRTKSIKNCLQDENSAVKTAFPIDLPIQNLINNVVHDILGPDTTLDLSAKQISTSPHLQDSYLSERKKVSLPDIAQVRRLNEKLLTAEVTPMQSPNTTKPPVNIVSSQQNLQNNDNICDINLSSSHFDTIQKTDTLSGHNKISRESMINRFNNQQQKNVKDPKKRYNHVELTWNPPAKKNIIPQDRLLTPDTVDKILNVCRGETDVFLKNPKAFKKALKKKVLSERRKERLSLEKKSKPIEDKRIVPKDIDQDNEVAFVSEQVLAKENSFKDIKFTQNQQTNLINKEFEKKMVNFNRKPRIRYCCWAREKVLKMGTKKRVLKKHNCLQSWCNCCCRHELVEKMLAMRELDSNTALYSETEPVRKPIKITVTSAPNTSENPTALQQKKNSAQIPVKVSVGINTDFDMDFENGFAANLTELKLTSNYNNESLSASSINFSYAPNANQLDGQTQTSVNLMILHDNTKSNQRLPYKDKIPIKNHLVVGTNNAALLVNKPIVKHMVTKRINLISDKNKLTDDDSTNNTIAKSHSKLAQIKLAPKVAISSNDPKTLQSKERADKLDKVLLLSNNGIKASVYRSPISLGKNKILLCSFEKSNLKNQPKLVNTTNNNDSGQNITQMMASPQIDSPQVALPEGVRIVLLPNKELALSIDPGVELDSTQLSYLPTLMASIQQQLTAADSGNVTSHSNELISNDQNNITLNKCNESEIKLDNKNDVNTTEPILLSCNEQMIDLCEDIAEVDITKQNNNNNPNKQVNTSVVDNSNNCVVGGKDNSDKKTILSDLMVMSGISTEDTNIVNNVSPSKQLSDSCAVPFQVKEKIMNNSLINNPVVQTALNRCPELCIVFSYQELKFASDNNAQFFKMDVETGVILPINLLIKKQGDKTNEKYTFSQSVIDLTEEDDTTLEEQNVKTLEKGSVTKKNRAVPVKLYSAIHPPILRRGKSILLNSLKSNPSTIKIKDRKMIRVIRMKHKRKEPLENITSIDLDSDFEHIEYIHTSNSPNSKVTHEEAGSDNESDSDDEPLALKAKRMKTTEPTESMNQIITETNDEEEILVDNQNTEMVSDNGNELSEIVEEENMAVEQVLPSSKPKELHANMSPLLQPVVFESPESSDEDCILGV